MCVPLSFHRNVRWSAKPSIKVPFETVPKTTGHAERSWSWNQVSSSTPGDLSFNPPPSCTFLLVESLRAFFENEFATCRSQCGAHFSSGRRRLVTLVSERTAKSLDAARKILFTIFSRSKSDDSWDTKRCKCLGKKKENLWVKDWRITFYVISTIMRGELKKLSMLIKFVNI